MNKMIEELSQLESVKEVTLKHNKQLTDDVANMTSENLVRNCVSWTQNNAVQRILSIHSNIELSPFHT